jgi:DNA topoisomerase VI, subunit A
LKSSKARKSENFLRSSPFAVSLTICYSVNTGGIDNIYRYHRRIVLVSNKIHQDQAIIQRRRASERTRRIHQERDVGVVVGSRRSFVLLVLARWLIALPRRITNIMTHSLTVVLSRINKILEQLVSCLEKDKPPQLVSPYNKSFTSKYFTNISQCRSLTSIVLVLSFVQKLLLSNRTTTNREVYYFFITYFRSQRECDSAIADVCSLLAVERISLGLAASPKGT